MSWQFALMAASTAMSAMQGMQQARAQETEAKIRSRQAQEDMLAVEGEALEEEARRRRAFEELQASNRNAAVYDPHSSQSFLALEKRNEKDMEDDVSAIQFSGAQRRQQLLTTKGIHDLNAQSARRARRFQMVRLVTGVGSDYAKYGGGGSTTTSTTSSQNLMTPGGSSGFYQGM